MKSQKQSIIYTNQKVQQNITKMKGQEWDCTISDQSRLLINNTFAVLLYFILSPKPLSIGHQKWKWITLFVHMLLYYHQQLHCTHFTEISLYMDRKKITKRPTYNYFSSKLQKPLPTLHNAVLVAAQSCLSVCLISSFSISHRQLCRCSKMAASTSF